LSKVVNFLNGIKKAERKPRLVKKYRHYYFNRLGASGMKKSNLDLKMTAEIDLMNEKKMYVVKDGRLIAHELPDYGQTIVITMGGKVDRLETT
jgi:hypothetical protein